MNTSSDCYFDRTRFENFYGSPDGKTIGVARFHPESAVVLLQESKPLITD